MRTDGVNQDFYYNQNEYNNNNNKIRRNINRNNTLQILRTRTTAEVNDLYQRFIQTPHEIQSFYDIETMDDPASNVLKKEEKEILNNDLDSLRNSFINKFINSFRNNYVTYKDNKNLVYKLIREDNDEAAFQYKIEKFIKKIEKNENEFRIDYLTVMLVGKSGVGKSTLINQVLNLDEGKEAKEGAGKFVTVKYQAYKSDSIPFLRLVDTRGIELNKNYGPDQVKKDAEDFIIRQKATNDQNNFVQCIWYCLTGDRFEDSEITLPNSLRSAYEDSKIPIILIYTQATDKNLIEGMKKYIMEKNK